jgi:hypothetical protein
VAPLRARRRRGRRRDVQLLPAQHVHRRALVRGSPRARHRARPRRLQPRLHVRRTARRVAHRAARMAPGLRAARLRVRRPHHARRVDGAAAARDGAHDAGARRCASGGSGR